MRVRQRLRASGWRWVKCAGFWSVVTNRAQTLHSWKPRQAWICAGLHGVQGFLPRARNVFRVPNIEIHVTPFLNRATLQPCTE
jgi:hypothetical protein